MITETIKKELGLLGQKSGHEICEPVPLWPFSEEDQAKVVGSRWVIGPCSGILKARFVHKGFTQIIDKEAKYAHSLGHSNSLYRESIPLMGCCCFRCCAGPPQRRFRISNGGFRVSRGNAMP